MSYYSETTTTDNPDSNWITSRHYSCGSNMDHVYYTIKCKTCGNVWSNEDSEGPEPEHDRAECSPVGPTVAQLLATPHPDDEPF